MIERTLVILKPDAVQRGLVGAILTRFERAGLTIKAARLSEADRDAVLDEVMTNPSAGDIIRKSGGVRKVRIGKEESGKSGGYRALPYFMDMEPRSSFSSSSTNRTLTTSATSRSTS